jgi:hypothetical protein
MGIVFGDGDDYPRSALATGWNRLVLAAVAYVAATAITCAVLGGGAARAGSSPGTAGALPG